MKALTTTDELRGVLNQPFAFVFVNAEWSGPSVRGKRVLETEWWPAVQKALDLSQPVFEVDIDCGLYTDTLWPLHIQPTGLFLWSGPGPGMLGSGEFLWFVEGRLADLIISTASLNYEEVLQRTKAVTRHS